MGIIFRPVPEWGKLVLWEQKIPRFGIREWGFLQRFTAAHQCPQITNRYILWQVLKRVISVMLGECLCPPVCRMGDFRPLGRNPLPGSRIGDSCPQHTGI